MKAITELWVCLCLREFTNQAEYDFHEESCPEHHPEYRDPIQDIIDGKKVSVTDPNDPLLLSLYPCDFCTPERVELMINAAAACMVDPNNKPEYDRLLQEMEEHLLSHHRLSPAQ